MMMRLIWLLVMPGLANCLELLPTRGEIEMSINRTIEEVERMVRNDPSLPRLTRNEIVDILYNITTGDMKSYEKSVQKTRQDYERALMIVLPYNTNETGNENLKELYEKPPMTRIVKDPSKDSQDLKEKKVSNIGKKSELPQRYDNHRDTYADIVPGTPTQESLRVLLGKDNDKYTSPEKFSLNLENFGTSKNPQSHEGTSFGNVLTDFRPNKEHPKLEIVYSTSVTQRPTTKLTMMVDGKDDGFRPTMPTARTTENVLTSDQWRYNAPPSSMISAAFDDKENRVRTTPVPFLPTMMTNRVKSEEETSMRMSQGQMNEKPRIIPQPDKVAHLYVTPMPSMLSRHQTSSSTMSEPKTTEVPMREEVQDLLASIGLHPRPIKINDAAGKVEDLPRKIFGSDFQIPESTNVIGGTAGLTDIGEPSSSLSGQNTFERTPQEVRKGVENLSPDVQLLFQRFGLQSSLKDETVIKTTAKPRVHTTKTSFWTNFKPLPVSQVKDTGMRDFLATFGLGVDESRQEKSMNPRESVADRRPSLIEAVPANMKKILENIGLITSSRSQIASVATTEAPQLHIFKPHETFIDNEKQRAKINVLLDTVKLVQDGRADVNAVQKAARELLETTKYLKNGPDPVSLEEILRIYNNDLKNEIKRQQDPNDLADMAISDMTNVTSTMRPELETTTMNSSLGVLEPSGASSDTSNFTSDSKDSGSLTLPNESANLESLADSFGGTTSIPDTALPTPRRTGLYFLVDWNTFLEVGEDEKDKVNLRFQPKAGDRTRFLPVTVP